MWTSVCRIPATTTLSAPTRMARTPVSAILVSTAMDSSARPRPQVGNSGRFSEFRLGLVW